MISNKKTVIKNSILYTFSSALVKAIGLLMLPFYTRMLSAEDYGTLNLVNVFTLVGSILISFSTYSSIIRFYTIYQEKEKRRELLGNIIIFISISGIFMVCISFMLKNILVIYIFENLKFFPEIIIIIINVVFYSLYMVHQNTLKSIGEGKELTKVNLLIFIFQTILILLTIGYFQGGIRDIFLIQLLTNFGYFIYMIRDLRERRMIEFKIELSILKEVLKYSIPIIPHNLSTQLANFLSRIFIKNSGTLATVGIYSVSMQISSLIDLIQTSVNQAFVPWIYKNLKDNSGNKEIINFMTGLLHFYTLLYIGLGIFSKEIILIIAGEKYIDSWKVIPILVMAFSVKSIYYFYINLLFYDQKTSKKVFLATVIGSLSDVIISFILIPKYGIFGAATSFLLAKIIVTSILVYISNELEFEILLTFNVKSILKIIFPGLFWMFLGISLNSFYSSMISIVLKITIIIIYSYYVIKKLKNINILKKRPMVKI